MPQRAFNIGVAMVGLLPLAAFGPAPTWTATAQAETATMPASAPATQAGDLKQSKEWAKIAAAWEFITPLAESGKSTEAQRKQVDQHAQAIQDSAFALAKAGMLDESEASLLTMESARLKSAVYRNPATDSKEVVQYDKPARFDPAAASYGRVSVRLQFLQKIVKSGNVHPEVIAKVLPSLEADLQVLADEKAVESLPEHDRKLATDARQQAQEAVEAIKKLLLK